MPTSNPSLQIYIFGSGSILKNASVSLEQWESGAFVPVESNASFGTDHFTLADLLPGKYRIAVTHPSFEAVQRLIRMGTNPVTKAIFTLGPPGAKYLTIRGRTSPIVAPENRFVVVLDKLKTPGNALLQFFEDFELSIVPQDTGIPSVLLLEVGAGSVAAIETIKEQVLAVAGVHSGGMLVSGERFAYLSSEVTLYLGNPELTNAEVSGLLAAYDLQLISRDQYLPDLCRAKYNYFPDLDLLGKLEDLNIHPAIAVAEPTLIVPFRSKSAPGDFLFPEQWNLSLLNVQAAWDLLEGQDPYLKYGRMEVIIAVHDNGIETQGNPAVPTHPDFIGQVTSGTGSLPKIAQFFDFQNLRQNNEIDYGDAGATGHGSMVASIAGALQNDEGIVGVAPNVQLMGHVKRTTDTPPLAAYFRWVAGLKVDFDAAGFPSANDRKPSLFSPALPGGNLAPWIINNSWNLDNDFGNPPLSTPLDNALRDVVFYGRNGRGILNFFATGQSGDPADLPFDIFDAASGGIPHPAHPFTLAVGASTLDDDGKTEIHAPYSNVGAYQTLKDSGLQPLINKGVEFCAPSHDIYISSTVSPVSRQHVPPQHYALFASHFLNGNTFHHPGDQGNVPGKAGQLDFTVKSGTNFNTAPKQIAVTENSALVPGQYLIIGNFGVAGQYEINQVDTRTSDPDVRTSFLTYYDVALQNALQRDYPAGTPITALSLKATLQHIVSATGNKTIQLNSAAGFLPTTGPGKYQKVFIGSLLSTGTHEINYVDTVDIANNKITLLNSLVNSYSNAPIYVAGGIVQTQLVGTNPVGPGPGLSILVPSAAGFQKGHAIFIGTPGSPNAEAAVITNAPDNNDTNSLAGITLEVDNLNFAHIGATIIGGRASYANTMGGTSGACPQAAGVAALVLSVNKDLTWIEVRDILRKTAVPVHLNIDKVYNEIYNNLDTHWLHTDLITKVLTSNNLTGIPAVSTTLSQNAVLGDTVITLSNATGFQLRQAIRIGNSTNEIHVITKLNVNNNPNRVAIYPPIKSTAPWPPTSTVVDGGKIFHYSPALGFGRLDAGAAVQAALLYTLDQRDLMLRDKLSDDGVTVTNTQFEIDSPDIWVRNVDPAQSNEQTLFQTFPYATAGPHQQPLKDYDRYLYARIKNRGDTYSNLEAWVRFYLVLDDPGTQFEFPNHFLPTTNGKLSQKGVKLIGQLLINQDEIAPGDDKIVHIPWPEDTCSTGSGLEANILVQISPHDGPNGHEQSIYRNSNLSRKKVKFVERISFNTDQIPASELPRKLLIPINNQNSPSTAAFRIDIMSPPKDGSDWGPFQTESASIEATLTRLDNTQETVTFKHSGSAWSFYDGNNAVFVPTNGWISIGAPLKEPFLPADLATGLQDEILFKGTLTVSGQYANIELKAHFDAPGNHSVDETHNILIQLSHPDNAGLVPSDQTSIYFFTNPDLLAPQVVADAYGPKNGNSTTEFRTTSRHKANTDPWAYAVCNGQVLVQQDPDPLRQHLVNVIIKPQDQGAIDFFNIKFFVYRGVLKNTLVNGSAPDQVAVQGTSQFLDSLWLDVAANNDRRENADANDAIGPGSLDDRPSVKALGIHYVHAPANSDQVLALDTQAVESLFLNNDADFSRPPVKKGWTIGKFDKNGFGFDVIVEGQGFEPTLDMVRKNEYSVVYTPDPALTNPGAIYFYEQGLRSRILNFLDPCALYGTHFNYRVLTFLYTNNPQFNSNQKDTLVGNGLYDQLLVKFFNSDAVYLDIRNENGYPMDYYDSYGNTLGLAFDVPDATTPHSYATYSWPLKILHKADFPTTVTGDRNIVKISLPKGVNTRPLLYMAFGQLNAKYPAQPKDKNKFVVPVFQGTNLYSDDLIFACPNRSGFPNAAPSCWYIKLYYIQRPDPGFLTTNPKLIPTIRAFDNLFPLIDLANWNVQANVRSRTGLHYKYFENDKISCMVEVGIALEGTTRVFLFATPTDVYQSVSAEKKFFKRLTGGTSTKPSFLETLKNTFPKLVLKKQELILSPNNEFVLFYDDIDSDVPRENIIMLGMGYQEYQNLVAAITSFVFLPKYHYPTLKLNAIGATRDNADNAYYTFDFLAHGIAFDGTYKTLASTSFELNAFSLDGINVNTKAASQLENAVPATTGAISWEDDPINPGKILYRLGVSAGISRWPLRKGDGTIYKYGSGEPLNGQDIYIPAGARVVKLRTKSIQIAADQLAQHFEVACWQGGLLRQGFVHENALRNALPPRDYNPESNNELYKHAILEAFVNDAEYQLEWAYQMHFLFLTNPDYRPYFNILESISTRLKGTSLLGNAVNQPGNSLRKKFDAAVISLVQNNDSGPIDALWAQYKLLIKDCNFQRTEVNDETSVSQNRNVGIPYVTVLKDGKSFIDKGASAELFNNLPAYKNTLTKKLIFIIRGTPQGRRIKTRALFPDIDLKGRIYCVFD
ncbi:MAG: S8 family serine peptidase [Saprospiraceae bacterium]